MENMTNGLAANGVAGMPHENGFHEPTQEELERELPMVFDGQVPLGELVARMAQSIYAEVTELAETLPNMSDSARKRTLVDWVVQTKRQVVKLYAVVKWARDADVVQKAMNVTAFLMDQNRQFEDALHGLKYAKESLDPARLRNHDLLTSLDVLTTGSYRRLPSVIKKIVIPPTPLTDEEVAKTIADVEDVMRYRLRMIEIIPCEMSRYRISGGRVFFVAPRLFEASLCVRGAHIDDGWFFVSVEFLFTVGGDQTGMQEFPRKPTGLLKRHIADEADARLAFYLPLPPDLAIPPQVEVPPRPQLPDGVADAPLVRVFNLLQMMSLSYQLEILWYQAQRMRSLGWAEYMAVGMANNRQTLTLSYWIRRPPPSVPGRPAPHHKVKIPPLGGTLTVSIVRIQPTNSKLGRSPKDRVLAALQEKAKLDSKRPSDEVEQLRLDVKWEPEKGALGINVSAEDIRLPAAELVINPDDLDIDTLLRMVISKHTEAILKTFQAQLHYSANTRNVFSPPGEVTLVVEDGVHALRVHLCADEVVIVTIDSRTGRLNLRDTGDLAAARRGPRFTAISDKLNENPTILAEALVRLRYNTIIDLAEQKANYLGLQSYRTRNWAAGEVQKLGPTARVMLYINLSNFPNHYLVLVITDEDFRYALISVKTLSDTMYGSLIMEDIGWLDVRRIHGEEISIGPREADASDAHTGQKRKRALNDDAGREHIELTPRFKLETQVLRELYAYCCARVAYTKVEQQFKLRNIPYTHVDSSTGAASPELAHVQSSLASSIPALCVQSSDILSGAPAAEAAMPNIRVTPLNWWSGEQAQVVTCVKLKYVQQPVGKRAGGSSTVIRPSKRIIYDTRDAIVSFLSEDVDKCVDEFLEEWARVSKMVVIAREVAQMSREKHWSDVRLLSFDLQTVEFAYAADYTVSITCTDQLSPSGGSYELYFSRILDEDVCMIDSDEAYNAHEDIEPFLRKLLRQGPLAPSLHKLVALLRDTLPIVAELEAIRADATRRGENVDIFPKTAGWYRILYADLRHALDFRVMTGARVMILDGSHSLFAGDATRPSSGSHAHHRTGDSAPFKSLTSHDRDRDSAIHLLQTIPDFKTIVTKTIQEVISQGVAGQITPIDIGVICEATAVRATGRTLYEKVLQCLSQSGNTA
ncbi:MED14-domain-containing protein [Amylocystis lapponica]|nr:MED14-domain-containing protein [Amylocystis lapponica]